MSPESILRPRPDVVWQALDPSDEESSGRWSVFDPLARINYRCGEAEHWLYKQFDGRRSLRAIHASGTASAHDFSLPKLLELAHLLAARGLVQRTDAAVIGPSGSGTSSISPDPAALQSWLSSFVSFRLRGIDPDRWLRWLAPHTNCLFSSWSVKVWLTLSCLVAVAVIADFTRLLEQATLWQWLMQPRSSLGLFIVFMLTRGLHELGHALVLTRHGGRCPDIGLIFMLGAPCVYCDVTESWRLPSAWQRAAVAAGGMYFELIIACLAGLVWLISADGWVNSLALQTMIICSISTILINANPLMRFDGYYLLSDLLDEPNLKGKADSNLLAWVSWSLGIRSPGSKLDQRAPFEARAYSFSLAIFAAAGLAYRMSLSLLVVAVLMSIYASWNLTWIGRVLAVLLLIVWWVIPTMKFLGRTIRSSAPWGRLRLAALAAWCVLMFCAVPVPRREYSVGWVQPERMQGLYAAQTGQLHAVYKRGGETVLADEPIFELADIQPRLRVIETAHMAEKTRIQLISRRRQRSFSTKEEIDLRGLEVAVETAQRQSEHARTDLEQMVVRSKIAGTLISLPAAKVLDIDHRVALPAATLWLDEHQLGRAVPAGTMLGTVCSRRQLAVLPLTDSQLQTVSVGTAVRIHIPASGQAIIEGQVQSIVRLEPFDMMVQLLADPDRASVEPPSPQTGGFSTASQPRTGLAAIVSLPEPAESAPSALASAEARVAFVVPPETLAARANRWLRWNLRWMTE